ncbi:hypothetical protein ABEB36_012393 [Hypothenemus hampei]|uniref:Acyl-coenzyme A oxidase n=1 Tax=Hypothenemus hampei TaxID=57062 RepID=A0ABD1EFE4_HYPHA
MNLIKACEISIFYMSSFVIFNNYEIPRENLLNKLGDVTQEGEYITPFKDPNKRHGAALGALSMGRVNITSMCEFYGSKAITIAIRYGAVRKQFGPDDKEEIPILEYQSHQYRLLPYLAAVYVLRIFSMKLIEVQYQFAIDSYLGVNKELLAELGPELHALSSASKPVSGWTMRDTIQECRETCGGHGYLKVSGIGDIRNDNDANLTYEGENHILIQQTSNWLLKLWPLILKGETISSPLKSVNFLSHGLRILQQPNIQISSVADACSPQNIISMYQWLVVYLLKRTYNKFQNDLNNGKDAFAARNNNQVFYAKNLSIAFIQHFMLQVMYEKISATSDPEIRSVLEKLLSLYGLFSLEKQHLTLFYQGAILPGSDFVTLIQEAILKLCSEVKNDAVSLVDVVAPPDFILKSVLGLSDGQVYRNLESAIFRSPYAMSRPKWWQDIKTNVQSKL